MNTIFDDFEGRVLATGVGSLPCTRTQDAVDFMFQTLKAHIPFWPQLPRRSFYENMYVQFCEKFPGAVIDETAKTIAIDTAHPAYLGELEECFNESQGSDENYFALSRPYAEGLYYLSEKLESLNWKGWVKAQLIGPLSLGLSLLDEAQRPILYNAELGELLPHFLARKAAWIIRKLRVNTGINVIIFVDEPYLVAVGTSQCGLSREALIGKINQVVRVIHDNGARAGLHCCGNTDWDLVMATDIDILNFDAFEYLDKLLLYNRALEVFLGRGGVLAFGVVPTNEEALAGTSVDKLFEVLKKQARFFKNGALITTSCGCNGLSVKSSEMAHQWCVTLAERLRQA